MVDDMALNVPSKMLQLELSSHVVAGHADRPEPPRISVRVAWVRANEHRQGARLVRQGQGSLRLLCLCGCLLKHLASLLVQVPSHGSKADKGQLPELAQGKAGVLTEESCQNGDGICRHLVKT